MLKILAWPFTLTIIIVVLTVSQTGDVQAAKAAVLSPKEAIRSALSGSPDYITSKNQVETRRLEVKNASAAFLPSLELSAGHGFKRSEPRPVLEQTPIVSGATLSLTENFYDNGESLKRYSIAKARLELAELSHRQTVATIIQRVLLAYYRYVISAQSLSFTKKNHDELERLAKLVSNQYYHGLKTKKDFLSFKTRAQRGRLNVIEAERRLVQDRSELIAAIGISPEKAVRFDESVRPVVPKQALLTDLSPEDLYEAKSLRLQSQIGDLEVDLARKQLLPQLSLVGSASYGSSNYIDTNQTWSDNDSTQWSVLLNLKFNILDWGTRSRNIQIASLQQNTNEQTHRASLLKAEKELEVFKEEVSRSQERYRLSKDLQKLEEDTFKLLERDYRAGHATYLELTTGLANLLDAQARGLEAEYDQAELYLRWKYYRGKLSEETALE